MTSATRSTHNWPLIVLATFGLIVLSPFILALLFTGLVVTLGVLGVAIKIAAVVAVIWLIGALFKALFGHSEPRAVPPPSTMTISALRTSPDAEFEREKRETMAALDRELALAMARKKAQEEGEAKSE